MRRTVQVVGRRMDAEHYRLRDFLTRTAQPYEWHEAESPEADQLLKVWDSSQPAISVGRVVTSIWECVEIGRRRVHLRVCMTFGKIGSCDSSPNKHATAHGNESMHPIIRSAEPGEDWSWCYVDGVAFEFAPP